MLPPWKESYNNLDSVFKSRDITLLTKVHLVKAMVFPVVLYQCETWTIKKAECQSIDAFELWCWKRLLRAPWNAEIKPVTPKGNQPWIFIGRTDAEAEASILWPPDVKSWLTWKDPDAGTDWRQTEKVAAEDEMVKEHHGLSGHEFEQTPGDTGVRGAWHAAVIEIAASQTQRSSWTATTG